jgi:hypothetical protein
VNIYLGARVRRREELCGYMAGLEARGHRVPARWLLGAHQITNEGLALGAEGEAAVENPDGVSSDAAATIALREKFAFDDLEDVHAAELLIAFTEQPRSGNSRGGRHVEFGIALGRGVPIIVVGPRENIFCCLPYVTVYPTWRAALGDDRLS